jgi:hypothetical protein
MKQERDRKRLPVGSEYFFGFDVDGQCNLQSCGFSEGPLDSRIFTEPIIDTDVDLEIPKFLKTNRFGDFEFKPIHKFVKKSTKSYLDTRITYGSIEGY